LDGHDDAIHYIGTLLLGIRVKKRPGMKHSLVSSPDFGYDMCIDKSQI
jgi:hypothetical protein